MVQENGNSQTLSILNERPSKLNGPGLLHELVRSSVHDATAIDFLEHGSKRRKFSYKTLHDLSDALARRITRLLAKLESASPIIPVLLTQSPELYIVLLAILKAGRAFCPLNLDTPTERLKFILEDISADLLVTISSHDERVRAATSIQVLFADHELSHRDDDLIVGLPQPDTDKLAYVLYTSGSTGLPKAVSVSHRAVTQSLLAHDRHIPDFSRFLQFAAPVSFHVSETYVTVTDLRKTFDVSIFEIFFPWFRGRTLVGCTRTEMLDDLPGMINKLEVDAAELTPTVVGNLLNGRSSVPDLKLLLTIGEMLTPHVIEEYGGDKTKDSVLWAMYGPTEASIHCTLQPCFPTSAAIGMIGFPLDTVSAFIIAPSTEFHGSANIDILPVGQAGELAIGGPQVAEEYLRRPDLTNAAFVKHPTYGRIYRTGDRAKICDNGTLECLGRVVVGQVKLRGQRVELGEIEQAIMRVDSCRTATVMIIHDNLVAFCATSSPEVSRGDVIEICKRWLPASMVPSDICFVDSMPQLPSGKVDRGSLERKYLLLHTNGASASIGSVPDDGVSRTVSRILRQHTAQDLGLDSHLAVAGLDSLRSIRIASALRQEGFGIGAMEVFSAATLGDLIAVCRDCTTTNSVHNASNGLTDTLSHIELPQLQCWKDDIVCILPCTPLQEAMLAETAARPSAYCNWIEVELPMSRTYEQIQGAVRSLASNIEILRTGFCSGSPSLSSFNQIIWKGLSASQIRQVTSFSRAYSLEANKSLLRPFSVQVIANPENPRLLFRIHHALYDGWSFDLLLKDLVICLRREKPAPRPQFRNIVRYFTREARSDYQADAMDYWTSLLIDFIPATLPNYNGKLIRDTNVRRFSRRSGVDHNTLLKRAQKLAVSPQVFFQAATAYILSLYSGSGDVVLGNVTSGRTIPVTGVEDIIGPCIASVPFRISFEDTLRVRSILHKTQALNRESLRHSALPLRDIARAANVCPGSRLFDVLFVWQQSMVFDSETPLAAKVVDSADELEFKLTLEFEPRTDYISFRATFDPSTISEHQIQYLSRQIDEVVELFLSDIDGDVARIKQCFTAPSLSIANPTPSQRVIEHGPSYAVEQWASRDPNRKAITLGHVVKGVMEIKEVSYGTLNSRANQFARVLQQHGVSNDQLVAIIMEKSVDLYVSILAVLKLRCGYLPLVPDTPIDRLKTILADAEVAVCVSESSALRQSLSIDLVEFDLAELASYPVGNLDIPYNGQHLAYAVFTSGSTGKPKGVLVTQENLMSNLQYLSTIYPYSTESRLLQSCSQAFDVSVFEIFFSWYVGICLCTARKDDLFRDFEAAINRLGVTHLSLTPTVAALVDPRNVPKVEFLVTAGEALTEHVRRRWAGRGLYQGYGPSETTNICTVRPAVTPDDSINNIGSPFNNTLALVLDPDSDAILPRGAVGELCFGGSQVFRGYLNRPELNAAKIIDHPTYGRVYRSGDMGILLPDDCILSTGRSDDQVKIRGQRVELGEITSVVLDSEAVGDCVTLLLPGSNNIKTLVNFWVPADSTINTFQCLVPKRFGTVISELFELLSKRLPSYMVPSHLVPISALPMTPQAKIDKRLLQRMFDSQTEDTLLYATQKHNNYDNYDESELSSQWEKEVAQLLGRTLGIPSDELRRTSSFFNLGLDSVSAIRFCNGLRVTELGDFSVSEVLKNPSIAHLGSIRTSRSSIQQPVGPPATILANVFKPDQISQILLRYEQRGLPVTRILPCTPLQEAMLSRGQSSSGSAYCNVMVFDIKGDVSQLQACWASMVQRHEILRTSFASTEDSSYAFAQVILHDSDIMWHKDGIEDNLQSRATEAITALLEANKPPVYFSLVQEETSTKLLFCCHHALYDGIAVSALLNEVQNSYNGCELPTAISYDVYLQHMLDQDLAQTDKYWAALFKDFEPTFFPDLTGEASRSEGFSSSSPRTMAIPLTELRKACQSASVSLLSVVQAAWAKLLHLYTGEHDICFGNVVSGRSIPGEGLDRLVAPCFNTLPIRANFDFQKRNEALMSLTHTFNVDSMAYQLTPLRRIQNMVLQEGGRLFDTLVILQQPMPPLDTSIWTLEQDLGDMDLPIVCEVIQDQTEDVLKLVLHHNTSLLSEAGALLVVETFDICLSSLVKAPQQPSTDIAELPTHLRAQFNMDFKRLDTNARFLHSGFERIASLYPDRTALDFLRPDGTRTTWNFGNLNEKANDIAHALVARGAKPEDIVPVHMLKSPHFYASILGVLKAGAAFAPVHPDLPEARRQFMLTELKPKLVLCSNGSILPQGLTNAITVNVDTIERTSGINPTVDSLKGSNLAYCLFTSGSTGVPKAVSMEHRAPMQTIESSRSLVPWKPSSRLLQYAAITFDMCYYDCFLAWTFGFALCMAEQNDMLNDLSMVINTLGTDLLDLTPSVAVSLSRSEVPEVNWLYCIGEAMSSDVVKEWDGACVNSYGPTEAAFCTTIQPVSQNTSTSIIGKPFPTTSFAVFTPSGDQPLPVLSIGELYIGGTQLARGYYGNPDLTSERFVTRCGQRFYKSGDMVRMLSDGSFEFIGRADDQVKIRGLRVELGEINHILQDTHPDVLSATTQIMKKDAASKEQLVSFLVLRQQIERIEHVDLLRTLKKGASSRLPSYMVPQFFLIVYDIPRSMSGKIDKNALASIFRESVDSNSLPNGTSEHRWSDLEKQIREVLCRLSKTPKDKISPTTSIYQLGLDSISAVQIAAALRKQGHAVTASSVMKYTTCTDLAEFIDQDAASEAPTTPRFDFDAFEGVHRTQILSEYNIRDEDIAAIRPCTPLQKAMVSQFLATEGAAYMNYLRLQLESNVNLERLREAWFATVKRHDMLRTGFTYVKDTTYPWVMVQYTQTAVNLPWTGTADDGSSKSTENWLYNVQRGALGNLHLPPWQLRTVQEDGYHYLELAIFHALFDAQSLELVFDDVVAVYHGRSLQSPRQLDPIIDGIITSSERSIRSAESFWTDLGKKANACRFPNLSPLRHDPLPPAVCTKQSARSISDLEHGCQRANITLQAAGISSWLSLLAANTGEPSVTCGVVLSGRNFEAAEHAVFPCINTVPFTYTVSKDKRRMLDAVMKLNAGIQQHQSIPLNEIHKLMGFPNEALFDTVFAYQKLSSDADTNDLWRVVDEMATIEYPISIELEPKEGRLEYRLNFLPHLIPREQAKIILEQLDHLMESFILHPRTNLDETDAPESLYSITPAKEAELPSGAKLLHELVEHTAANYPHRTALEFVFNKQDGSRSVKRWTYAELNAEGNRIAQLLAAHGVPPGSLVGVCFDKCPEASFAMLGVLKAGCAFVAIDPGAPAARQAFIVKDSQVGAVLSISAQSAQFKVDIDVSTLNLDEIEWQSLSTSKPLRNSEISPQDRSYCLYTSGTTGTPKGCELTHENAVQALLAFQRLFAGHWDARSRWLQFASFHFDVSVLEQYWSWSVGICVVSAPRDLIFEDLAKSIRDLCITHIDLTPSLAQILHPDDVPDLCKGVFITGGESLKQEILDVWGPKGVIYNGYGPTEATIGCTMYPRIPANGKPSNIGPQFDNVGSLVLYAGSDIPVLRGGIGELCVSGKLVGKGYLNRPELTAERFPYLKRFERRVYRTGDLVRILYDGTFDFLGRADDQVKLRGQRLEVGEISSVIRQSEERISDVATLVLKHPKQQKEQLVAFIVFGRISKTEPEVLLQHADTTTGAKEACHEKLPPYMVPTHFVPLTAMPLNVNNKADSRRLKEMYETLSSADLQKLSATSSKGDDDWSKQDQRLRDVLAESLSISKGSISKDTSFFELGMDSISVIGVSRALKQADFVDATASVVMRCPTIRRLAKALAANSTTANDRGSLLAAQQAINAVQHRYRRTVAQTLSIDASEIEALAPCTPLQLGMIARSLEGDNGLYLNTFQFKLHDDISEQKLQAAWGSVFTSTQILRTVFVNTEEGYVQAVLREVPFQQINQTTTKDQHIAEHLKNIRQDWLEYNRTDLRRPCEVHLVTIQKQKLLVVHIFHGLYDGNSIGLVFEAVWNAYNGRELDSGAPTFHEALAHGPLRVVDDAKDFWQAHLSNVTPSHMPTITDEPEKESIIITRELHTMTTFDSVRRQLNVTAQAIAQACWLSVLQEHVKSAITTGMVVSGRSIDLEGADHIVGPMFNTVPYHHRIERSESWASIIKRVHNFNVAAHPYQHTPLRDIMKWCKRSSGQPLFDILFVYQVAQKDAEWAKNDAWEMLDGDAVADYPLAFEVEQTANGGFKLTLVAQGHVVDNLTAIGLLDRFEEALQQVLRDPSIILESSTATNGAMQNGTAADSDSTHDTNGTSDFEWTDDAIKIRDEIASLSGMETHEIDEATSIFELGLDSIDAIKLSSKLKRRGVDLPVSGIMRGLTIAKMVDNVQLRNTRPEECKSRSDLELHKQKLTDHLEQQSFDLSGVQEVLPLTPLQEAMVAEMIASEYTRYYNFDVLELDANTDIEKLRDACTKVIEASPILRTGFLEVEDPELDDSFAQIVHHKPHDFWSHINSEYFPDVDSLFEELRKDAVRASLTIPPFHLTLINTSDDTYLVLSIAHALYDGWSLGLLHSDIHRAYHDHFTPRPSYETSLAEIVAASGSDAAGFWQDYLSDAGTSSFPRRLDASGEASSVHRRQQSSAVVLADLQSFAKKSNVSLQTIGQAVFALVSASYTHSLDVTFASVLSGRDDDKRSQLLFPTMNTVAIRTILHGTGIELLRYVQENFASIKQWQHYPLRKALTQVGVDGRLFESLFIYQRSLEEEQGQSEKLYTSVEGHSDVEYPVCVEMEVVNGTLVWRCAVKDEVFDEPGVKELLRRMDNVMRRIIDRPDAAVIEATTEGTSVCGLPAFQQYDARTTKRLNNIDEKHDDDATETETARKIRGVLAIVSKTPEDEIMGDMTIFHIGLDSISAIKASSLLRKQGIILSVGEMLRAGTVGKMARVVDARPAQSGNDNNDYQSIIRDALQDLDRVDILQRLGIDQANVEQILPVTAGQLYMLSMWLNTKGGNFYPEFTYELQEDVPFDVLQKSWQALVATNPILRTSFVATTNDRIPYVQTILKKLESSVTDTSGSTDEEIQTRLRQIASQQPWAHLFASRASEGWVLKLKIHHALYDGVSLPLLIQKLQDICNGVAVPPPSDTFVKLVASSCTASALKERQAFWSKYLSGFTREKLSQPQTIPTTKTEIFKPTLLSTSSLEATARKEGISTQAIFLAAYAKLYATINPTHSEDGHVVIGVYLANRSRPIDSIATAAIPTVNLLPLRIASPLKHNLVSLAIQIQNDLRDINSAANASASLYEISEWTGVKVDSFVNFLSLPDTETSSAEEKGITIRPVGQWQDPVSRVTAIEDGSEEVKKGILNERVNGVYLVSYTSQTICQ
jgi:amino acid adenylation domain-containing protein